MMHPKWIVIAIALLIAVAAPAAAADDAAARAIMEAVDAREDGDRQTSDMEMILIDKHGNQRVRKIRSFSMDRGEDDLRLMFFQHPADVRDTGFLTYDYDQPDKDDDQWLYLPALRKTKRIASSDKSGSFMGSDLNYSDMTSRDLDDYDFSFYDPAKKEMTVNGQKAWVILSVPRTDEVIDETGYRKSVLFVRQDNHYVIRTLNYEKKKGYAKYMEVKSLEEIEGIWVATRLQVTRKRGKKMVHQTLLNFNNVRFNQEMDEDLFTIRRLEKGL